MSLDCLNEAFKRLDALTEETFNTSSAGLNDLSSFLDKDNTDDLVKIIDPEAETEDDLKDSYIGKVIINCNICHSNIFKDKEEIVIDTDGIVNVEDQCPYCGEESGFTVIGEITPFTASAEDSQEEVEDKEDIDVTVSEENDDVQIESEDTEIETDDPTELEEAVKKDKWKPHTRKLMSLLGIEDDQSGLVESLHFTGSEDQIQAAWDHYREEFHEGGMNADDAYDLIDDFDEAEEFIAQIDDLIDDIDNPVQAIDQIKKINSKFAKLMADTFTELLTNFDEDGKALFESVNNVNVETDDSIVNVHTEEDGKVVVSTEPKTEEDSLSTGIEDETIAPLSDETQAEIENENGLDTLEDTANIEELEGEEIDSEETDDSLETDLDIEEIDEEGFDELGESYLKKVYENVESFKTTKVGTSETKLVVEGLITFKSGKQKKTGFIFEAHSINQKGILRFVGENKHLHEHKKAFTLTAQYKDKKLLPESLGYRYTSSDNKSKFGKVKRKK